MENLVTNALKLYEQLDAAIETHFQMHKKKAPCAKGCSSCCSQFFEISELEFLLIMQSLDTFSAEKINSITQRAQTLFSLFKENWPSFYEDHFSPTTITQLTDDYYKHRERFKVTLPCVFLSKEGSCEVYENRPIICRTTGVGFQHLINFGSVCDYIKIGMTTPLWQADLRPFKEAIDAVRWLSDPENQVQHKRQYPMFYYVYDAFINDQMQKYRSLK